jgi:hypothetical protein
MALLSAGLVRLFRAQPRACDQREKGTEQKHADVSQQQAERISIVLQMYTAGETFKFGIFFVQTEIIAIDVGLILSLIVPLSHAICFIQRRNSSAAED